MPRLDYTLARIDDVEVAVVPGGHELSTVIWVPRVDGDRLCIDMVVAVLTEFYAGWEPQDYQQAHLRIRRAARARLRELAVQAERDAD